VFAEMTALGCAGDILLVDTASDYR
jgi:hypothetical protein